MTIVSGLSVLFIMLTACSSPLSARGAKPSVHASPVYEKDGAMGITALPAGMGDTYLNSFDRYTEITAPSGGKIRIVAQNRITNEQILRARGILHHYLCDRTGLLFGGSKGAVADRMAANSAVLTLLNGRDDGSNRTEVPGQSLFEEELPVEGQSWYMENQYDRHRDAAFEEILHMVHDYGIGVDGRGGHPGALPDYQKRIREAQKAAMGGIWAGGADQKAWLEELGRENSLSQEYLAAVIDSYYGLWGAWQDPSVPESKNRGMWGFYLPKTRDELAREDPAGAALIDPFFCEWLSFNARIHKDFQGVFSLRFDRTLPYTHKTRYLRDVTLTGSRDSGVRVNGYDNFITGNKGRNSIYFSGSSNEYEIKSLSRGLVVKDRIDKRDGANTLTGVEELVFSDRTVQLKDGRNSGSGIGVTRERICFCNDLISA